MSVLDVPRPSVPTEEPSAARWQRRARTIPIMLGATSLGLVALPVALPALVVADLARGRVRLPSTRVFLFVLQYGINDSIEILLAPWYWILAGFGTRIDGRASIRRHEAVQRWSIATLARQADRLLGVRIELDAASLDALKPAPAIVLCRHVNLFDASLPALLYQQCGISVRGVIMAELLADPGFDLFYRRTGSIFIPRDNGPEARGAIGAMSDTFDDQTVAVIFPEGRLFRPELLDRFKAKIAATYPDRDRSVSALRHVLPPRSGGFSTLLDALPDGDVVVIAHSGFDPYPTFTSLARSVPLRSPIHVRVTRIARATIPDDDAGRVQWLDRVWNDLDDWLEERLVVDPSEGGPP